jgi:hypothetical protein
MPYTSDAYTSDGANNATVVQFGLGHQIANLVTRVQIPAVAFVLFYEPEDLPFIVGIIS